MTDSGSPICWLNHDNCDSPHGIVSDVIAELARSGWTVLKDNVVPPKGYAVIKVGEVPPWMEQQPGVVIDNAVLCRMKRES